MIRPFKKSDIDQVACLWLHTNILAHSFIPADYWQANLETVKNLLSQAELYVYEDTKQIKAFIGLDNTYIAGIFVDSQTQSCGIGKQLLDYTKSQKPQLTLNVYQKNQRAISFYQREHFHIHSQAIDPATGELEYHMLWLPQSSS